jgi:Flp pilus assembly protein TadG
MGLQSVGKRRNRRGAAAVEFAMVAPLLFLVVLCSIEFGRAMLVKQVLTSASRVAAREASLRHATLSSVTAAAQSFTENAAIFNTEVSVSPSPTAASTGDSITVTVSVSFDNVSWLPSSWFLGSVQLSGTSVMRKEGFD